MSYLVWVCLLVSKTLQYEVTYYPEYIVHSICYEYKYQVPGTCTASAWYQEWYAVCMLLNNLAPIATRGEMTHCARLITDANTPK